MMSSTITSQSAAAYYIIVGGGISGVSILEELISLLENEEVPGTSNRNIIFVTGKGGYLKRIVNAKQIGQIALEFNVESVKSDHFDIKSKRVQYFQEDVIGWDPSNKTITLKNSTKLTYQTLAITTGASAKRLLPSHLLVIRLRDTQTIKNFEAKLKNARRVLIIGNGGIATELAFELKNVEILWVIRHNSISATYFDAAAGKFFEGKLATGRKDSDTKPEVKMDIFKRIISSQDQQQYLDEQTAGSSLGPHWLAKLAQETSDQDISRKIHVINEAELTNFVDGKQPEDWEALALPNAFLENSTNWRLWALLSTGKYVGCDLIVEATGVEPNSAVWKRNCHELELGDDGGGGILVDERMRTNIPDVFAAGDVCTLNRKMQSQHWKQIRLWTQAYQMGVYCARSMLIDELLLDIAFDLFTHVTTFFGYKVILLGDFTGEKLEKPFEVNYRITEGKEYVKVLTKNHQVHGAVLIGETDLEETMENLILNQTDISQIEENLLDPNVDIEDYFD